MDTAQYDQNDVQIHFEHPNRELPPIIFKFDSIPEFDFFAKSDKRCHMIGIINAFTIALPLFNKSLLTYTNEITMKIEKPDPKINFIIKKEVIEFMHQYNFDWDQISNMIIEAMNELDKKMQQPDKMYEIILFPPGYIEYKVMIPSLLVKELPEKFIERLYSVTLKVIGEEIPKDRITYVRVVLCDELHDSTPAYVFYKPYEVEGDVSHEDLVNIGGLFNVEPIDGISILNMTKAKEKVVASR